MLALQPLRKTLAQKVYYGWFIVLACFLATIAVFGSSYSFSVFYDSFLEEFEASRSQIALIFGLQTTLIYSVGVGVARIIERTGQKRILVPSSVVLVFGLTWAGFAQSYLELLLSLGVVAPVGIAGLYIVGWATLPMWFERRRGAAVSIAATGTGISLVVVPAVIEAILRVTDWRAAMLGLAGLLAVLLLLAVCLFVDSPAAVGADRRIEFGNSPTVMNEPLSRDELQTVLFSSSFLLVFLGWLFIYTPSYVILSHIVLHAADVGVGRSIGVIALTTIGITATLTRVGIGLLSDRLGRVTTFVICSTLFGVASIGFAVSTTSVLMVSIAMAVGTGYGGAGGLLGAVTADLFGERSLNTLFATLSLSFSVTGLISPPLAGLWFEYAGSYDAAFVVAGVIGVVGAGCVVWGARLQGRPS